MGCKIITRGRCSCANGLINVVYSFIQIDNLRNKRCKSTGCPSCLVLFASGIYLKWSQFLQRKILHEGKAIKLKYFTVFFISEIILILIEIKVLVIVFLNLNNIFTSVLLLTTDHFLKADSYATKFFSFTVQDKRALLLTHCVIQF